MDVHVIDNKTDTLINTIKPNILLDGEHFQDAESKVETLEVVYQREKKPLNGIENRNRLLIKVNDEFREFVIENIREEDEEVTLNANASFIEDLDTAKPIPPSRIEQNTTKQYVNFALNGTGWKAGLIEYAGFRTISWTSNNTPLEVLNIIANRFDMSLRFRVEVEYNEVVGRYVDLVHTNHIFKGKEIAKGKDMEKFIRTVNTENLATALMCLGPEPHEEGQERIVVFVYDDEANEKYGKPGEYIWAIYSPETTDENMSRARLRSLGTTELNKRKEPDIDYEIEAVNLFYLYDHERVELYDKVRIKDEKFERYAEANTKSIRRSIVDESDVTYTFGDITEYDAEDVRADFMQIVESLREKLNDSIRNTGNIRSEIREDLKSYERKIEKSPTPPPEPIEGQFWLDTSNDRVAILKRWEDGGWVKSSASEASDVGAITREQALYETLTTTFETLLIRHTELQNEVAKLSSNEYLVDSQIKADMDSKINLLNSIFTQIEDGLQGMNRDTATIGNLIDIQGLIVDYRNEVHYLSVIINDANKSIQDQIYLLQSQYSEEKFNEAMNNIASKIEGIEFVDGALIGSMAIAEQLETAKSDLQQQLDDAKQAQEDIYDTIDGHRVNIDNVTGRIETAEGQLSDARSRVEEAENKISQAENTLSEHGDLIENHGVQITNIDGELDTKASQTELNSLSGTVSDHSTAISQNATAITSKADKSVVDSLTGTVGEHSTQISQNATDISSKADKSIVDALSGTVEDHATSISQNATDISSKADQSIVDTINDTVTSHTTLINQNATDISSKADKSVVDDIEGTVSSHTTLINQNATDISSKADASTVNEIDGIVSNHTTLINQNAEDISSKADASIVNALQGTVDDHATEISQNATDILSKADSSVVNTLNDEVENHSTQISQNSSSINTLIETTNNHDGRITTVTNESSETAEGLTQVISRVSQAESDIDSVELQVQTNINEISSKLTTSQYNTDMNDVVTRLETGETERTQLQGSIEDRVTKTEFQNATAGIDTRITENETNISQNGSEVAIRAKIEEMNQMQETFRQVISELIVDSANGLVYTYNENGTVTGYSVGPDGIEFNTPLFTINNGDVEIRNGMTRIKNAVIEDGHIKNMSFDKLQGGTAILGGSNQNGALTLMDAEDHILFQMDGEQMASSQMAIADLYVERIHNDDIVTYSEEDMRFFVTNSGDDDNQGTGMSAPFRTIRRAVEQIPRVYDGTAHIYCRSVFETEHVDLSGFSGRGTVVFHGVNSNGTPATANLDIYARFTVNGNSIGTEFRKLRLIADSGNIISIYNAAAELHDVDFNGGGDNTALYLGRDAFAHWRTGHATNINRGVQALYGSRFYGRDVSGRASDRALVSAYASMIDVNNWSMTGDVSNTSKWAGSILDGSFNYPSSPPSNPSPAPQPTERTVRVKSISGAHYYVSSVGWNNTYYSNLPMQGKWGSLPMKEGTYFFGSRLNQFTGKNIKRIRVYIGRSSVEGYTGSRSFTLRMHSHSSKPSGRPNMSDATFQGSLKKGERKWFTLPSTFHSLLSQSSWVGFGVKTTSTSNYQYMAMMHDMTVEVTYYE